MSTDEPIHSNNSADSASGVTEPTVPLPTHTFTLTESEFIAFLKSLTGKRGQVSEMARKWKVDNSELSKVLREKQSPGPKLLKALNARAETMYHVTVETEDDGTDHK